MKTIWGIWGWGVVGKSALNFLQRKHKNIKIFICTKNINPEDIIKCAEKSITVIPYAELTTFLVQCDYIIVSPGIDTSSFAEYQHKLKTEFDLFSQNWNKKIIGITGTLGKTSITHILSELLKKSNLAVATGGNIGIGMLDLINQNEHVDYAVLELSSFQLEHCLQATVDIAIISNIYPNHLDRHKTFDAYQTAKMNLIKNQINGQVAIIPWSMKEYIRQHFPQRTAALFYCNDRLLTHAEQQSLHPHEAAYVYDNNGHIIIQDHVTSKQLTHCAMPKISYQINWLMIAATLHFMKLPLDMISANAQDISLPHHRLINLGKYNGITFYNDSKSTVPEATLAAIKQLQQEKIILFLGGVSKGVNRELLIKQLPHTIEEIICFGKEAQELCSWCSHHQKKHSSFDTLEEAFNYAIRYYAATNSTILFSPAGASYDLFNNYEERGQSFVNLVHSLTPDKE